MYKLVICGNVLIFVAVIMSICYIYDYEGEKNLIYWMEILISWLPVFLGVAISWFYISIGGSKSISGKRNYFILDKRAVGYWD